ncbi:MAG: hypothetical protein RL026_297 [Pseudomonadota bacterium]|jgi:hypothetical protein
MHTQRALPHLVTRTGLLLLLSLFSASALAQGAAGGPTAASPSMATASAAEVAPRYVVEVLVFRTTGTVAAGEVQAAGSRGARGEFPHGSGAATDAVPGKVLEVLPPDRRRLAGAAARLAKDGGYRVVAHQAWIQTASPYNSGLALPLADVGLARPGLAGQVLVERGQYLHLGVTLVLDAPQGGKYVLQDTRRVRTGERHYFDHPAFGVIATVTPLERNTN